MQRTTYGGAGREALSKDMHETRQRQMVEDVAHLDTFEAAQGDDAVGQEPDSGSNASLPRSAGDIRAVRSGDLERYTRDLNNRGLVMNHGVLMIVNDNDADMRVQGVSDNSASLFGREPAEMFGVPMLDFFEERSRIQSAITMKDVSLANPVTVCVKPKDGSKGVAKVNLILHRSDKGLLVDVETLPTTENSFAAHQRVRIGMNKLQSTDNVASMCQLVVEEVSSTTGYDRCMMYKFHEDMHGEVISECRPNENLDSLLGIHYPATDVPQRTRDQFKANSVRIIVTAQRVAQARILFAKDSPLASSDIDLGMSSLRRAHDCHLEYMRGMGVMASLCLAIVVKDHLWGLVVCHHKTERFVSYQARMACDFLAQALSMRLSNLLDAENHLRHDRCLQLHAKLCDNMYQQGHNPGLRLLGLVNTKPNLMDLIPGVNGAGCVHGTDVCSPVGVVPDAERLAELVAFLRKKTERLASGEPWTCTSLRTHIPSFEGMSTTTGVLCIKVDKRLLIWLRPEFNTTIRWGGDPTKWVVKDGEDLRPRKSFETFVDSVKGTCTPWLRWEVNAALGLAMLVHDMLLSVDTEDVRSNVLVRLNDERMQTKGEKEAVVNELGQVMDSVSAAIITVDPQIRIIQWNMTAARMTGLTKEQVTGRNLVDFLDKENVEEVMVALSSTLQGTDLKNTKLTIVRPDGGEKIEFVINTSVRRSLAGNVVGVMCVGQDVNDEGKVSDGFLDKRLREAVEIHQSYSQLDSSDALEQVSESSFRFLNEDKHASRLGEGQFGKTYRMQSKFDEQTYAVKMINVKKAEKNGVPITSIKREVQMLLRLGHPSIIRYFTCYMYKNSKYFCIVMELLDGGTLADTVSANYRARTKIDPEKCALWALQMSEALAHIHGKKMLHRDLKPHNVLLSADLSEAKITDFGLACVVSSAAASSRAGTLNYASPEKAGAKGYNSKDDVWALGCIIVELVLSQPLSVKTEGGILAFNSQLVDEVCRECLTSNTTLGPLVSQLLELEPGNRTSAVEVVEALSQRATSAHEDAVELCEEYICPICQELVLDAHTVCSDEHVFCCSCLSQWLEAKNECPTCRTILGAPRRLRVINNAVEKLASRVLTDQQRAERESRRQEGIEAAAAAAQASQTAMHQAAERRRLSRLESEGEGARGVSEWKYAKGDAQFGSGCTILYHCASGVCVEVFHGNGWFRFRTGTDSMQVRWCNSCGNLGDSEFGAPSLVMILEAGGGGGETVPEEGLGALDDQMYWESSVQGTRIVLVNTDEEALVLEGDGAFVWLSHPGMNKAVEQRGGSVETISREDAMARLPNVRLEQS